MVLMSVSGNENKKNVKKNKKKTTKQRQIGTRVDKGYSERVRAK